MLKTVIVFVVVLYLIVGFELRKTLKQYFAIKRQMKCQEQERLEALEFIKKIEKNT